MRFILATAYWATTRLALYAVLLVTCLHFILNSGPFPQRLTAVLKSVLPGSIEFASLQISPVPWKVDVLDVHIHTPDGKEVITAGKVQVTMDLVPLVRWLLGESGDLLEIGFRSARLEDYSCVIAFDDDGDLEFLRAFVWPPEPGPEQPGGGGGPKVRLRFSRILADRGRFLLSFPDWDLRIDGISLETSLTVRESGEGVYIQTPDLIFTGGLGRIGVAPNVDSIPREVPIRAGRIQGFVFDKDRFHVDNVQIALEGFDLDAGGRLAFPGDGPLSYDGRAGLSFHPESPPVVAATKGLVQGPFHVRVEGDGNEADPRFRLSLTSPDLTVSGLPLGNVNLEVEGGKDVAGTYVFRGLSMEAHPGSGRLKATNAILHPYGRNNDGYPRIELNLEGSQVDLASVLESLGVPEMPRTVPIPRRLGGKVRASLSFGSTEDPETTLDVSARLSGTLESRSLMDGREASLSFKAGLRFLADGPVVRVRDLSLRAGRDQLSGRGRLDLGNLTFRASGDVQKELGSLMGVLGSSGQGVIQLRDVKARGSLALPELTAVLEGHNLKAADWSVDDIQARITLRNNHIDVADARFKAPYGTAALGHSTMGPLAGRPSARRLSVRDLTVTRWNLMRFPPLRDMDLKGSGKLQVSRADLQLLRPVETFSGKGHVTFPMLGAMGRRFTRSRVAFSAEKGRIEIPECTARLMKGSIEASGHVDLAQGRFQLSTKGKSLPLSAVAGTGKSGPLKGTLDLTADASGALNDPEITARVEVADLTYDELELGSLAVSASRKPGTDLNFSSRRFIPKIRLNPESGLTWENGRFSGVFLALDFDRLTPQDIHPSIRERDFWAQFTGNLRVNLGFGRQGTLRASIQSPPDGLELGFLDRDVSVINREKLEIVIHESQEMTVTGLALDDGSGILEVCGEILDSDGRTRLMGRGPLGMYWLRFLKKVFSVSEGYILLAAAPGQTRRILPMGCPANMMDGTGATSVSGTLWPVFEPTFVGKVTTGPIDLNLRQYPDPIHIDKGGEIVLRPASKGRVRAEITRDRKLRGTLGDGRIALYGDAFMKGYMPDEGKVHISGTDLRYSSAGSYFVVGNPELTATFRQLTEPDAEQMDITGKVLVTDGSYHKDFRVIEKAFSRLTGIEAATMEGPELVAVAPWLAKARLDLTVTGSQFGVRTRLPFGSSELNLALDLAVRGVVAKPEIWNRLEVLPGGKFIYNLVRREFEVQRGTLDFDGDPERPLVDVMARTFVEYHGTTMSNAPTSSRFDPNMATGSYDEEGVVILLNLSGRYPDLDVVLSSNTRDLDQTELLYLALTGQTSLDSTDENASSFIDIGILTENLANVVTNLLLSPFVDAVRFGVSSTGGVNAEVKAHLGSRLKLETRIMQEQGGSRYSAGFQMKLTDRFFLEGRVRAADQTIDSTEDDWRYETKLRYRIPLD